MKANIFLRNYISFQSCDIPYFWKSNAISQIIPLELHPLELKNAEPSSPTPFLVWNSFPHIILHNSADPLLCCRNDVFLERSSHDDD